MQNPNAGKVVMFTNITDKDFTHAFGGQPFFVKAGDTVPFPYDLGLHLATHLARRIFLDDDKSPHTYDPNHPDTKNGTGRPLWNEESERAMVEKILGKTFQEEVAAPPSEIELLRQKVDELSRQFSANAEDKNSVAAATVDGEYKDKAEVIAELTMRGIKFDARSTKDKLIALLEESKQATPTT